MNIAMYPFYCRLPAIFKATDMKPIELAPSTISNRLIALLQRAITSCVTITQSSTKPIARPRFINSSLALLRSFSVCSRCIFLWRLLAPNLSLFSASIKAFLSFFPGLRIRLPMMGAAAAALLNCPVVLRLHRIISRISGGKESRCTGAMGIS